MPQVTAGNHTFMVKIKVSNGNFTIQKSNLQVSIEWRDLEGGLSASIPRAEVIYTFLYNLLNIKINSFTVNKDYSFKKISDNLLNSMESCNYINFNNRFKISEIENKVVDINLNVMGIIEGFAAEKSIGYSYDREWINFSSDFEKNKDGTYDYYNRATIKETILSSEGEFV